MKTPMKYWLVLLILASLTLISCKDQAAKPEVAETKKIEINDAAAPIQFETLTGEMYVAPAPTESNMELYNIAKANYEKDPSLDNLIWVGRRMAYINKYQEAIDLYTKGLELYPDNPKLLRHRGHRYISVRQHDKAVADLERAAALAKDLPDEAEEGGNPNTTNKFYGSMKTGIYYHLGVAYYLKHDFAKAYEAFNTCRDVRDNLENYASCTNWMYMCQRRLGNEEKANEVIEDIVDGMEVVENLKYYELAKLYKGLPVPDEMVNGLQMHQDAVMYGMTNRELYSGNTEKAKEMLEQILEMDPQVSFGYMAAESDYTKLFAED